MKCSHCGHDLPDDAQFCMKCGQKLVKSDPSPISNTDNAEKTDVKTSVDDKQPADLPTGWVPPKSSQSQEIGKMHFGVKILIGIMVLLIGIGSGYGMWNGKNGPSISNKSMAQDSLTQAIQNTEMWNKVITSYINTVKSMGKFNGDGIPRHKVRDETLPLSTIPESPIVMFWNKNDSKYLTGYMGKRVVDNIELLEIKNRNKIDQNTIEVTTVERWTICGKQFLFSPIYVMKMGSNYEWKIYDTRAQDLYDQIYSLITNEVELGNNKLRENFDRELAKSKVNSKWVYVNRDSGGATTYVTPETILYNQDRSYLTCIMMLVFEQPTKKNIKRAQYSIIIDVRRNPMYVQYISTTAYDPAGTILMDIVEENPQWERVDRNDLLGKTIQYCIEHPRN